MRINGKPNILYIYFKVLPPKCALEGVYGVYEGAGGGIFRGVGHPRFKDLCAYVPKFKDLFYAHRLPWPNPNWIHETEFF